MKVKGRCYFVVSVWRNHTHRHRHVGTGSLLQFLGSFLNTKVNELWGSGTTWPTAVVCDSGCAVVFAYVSVVVCNPSIVSRAAQMFCRRMICRFTLCRCDDSVAPYGRGGLWDCERALWLGCGAREQHPGLCLCVCVWEPGIHVFMGTYFWEETHSLVVMGQFVLVGTCFRSSSQIGVQSKSEKLVCV